MKTRRRRSGTGKPTRPAGNAPSQRRNSLAWIAHLYFSEGLGPARNAFNAALEQPSPYYVIKSGHGKRAFRTDVSLAEEKQIHYEDYSTPPLWQSPYTVLRVRFGPGEKRDYMYHRGEEVLVPISGKVMYHFFFSAGGKPPRRELLPKPVESGFMIRVNPQIPHHTWAVDNDAEAWMVIRDSSMESRTIALSESFDRSHQNVPRHITEAELKRPERYALIAWGIAEKIRLHRERAKLSLEDVARACDVDRSILSRVEAGKANLPLHVLTKIATALTLHLNPLGENPWHYQCLALADTSRRWYPVAPVGRRSLTHFDLRYRSFSAGTTTEHDALNGELPGHTLATWIVLEGLSVMEIRTEDVSVHESLGAGGVIHFSGQHQLSINALKPARFLQVTYSSQCRPLC